MADPLLDPFLAHSPSPDMIVRSLGAVATRQQLIAAGISGQHITWAVRAGRIQRVRQGRYATPDAAPDVVAAVRIGGQLAGLSAAESYGLWAGFDEPLHVSVGNNSGRLRTNIRPAFRSAGDIITPDSSSRRTVIHWLHGGAVPELGPECWRVTLPVCLRQAVEWSSSETAIACLDTARTIQKISSRDLASWFESTPAAHRMLASRSSPGSDSGTESLVRQRLAAMRIPFRQQLKVPGVGRVDFSLTGTKIVIEVDGRAFHSDDLAFERDRWRDGELIIRGRQVIRLTYRQVTADWSWCDRVIRAALAT